MGRGVIVAVCLAGLVGVGCGGGDTTGSGGSGGSGATTATGGSGAGGSGAGGSTSSGGSTSTGGSGTGGSGQPSCFVVQLGEVLLTDGEPGGSSVAFEMTGLDPAVQHALYLEFYDVAGPQVAGTFDLSQPPDDNYATCAHCLLAFEDVNGETPTAYFPASGSLEVTTPDADFSAKSAGTFKSIRLDQVTIEGTSTVPVEGGKCLLLTGGWDTTQP